MGRILGLVTVATVLLALTLVARSETPYGLTDRELLSEFDGDYTVRVDGSTVENLEIRGTLRIIASDVLVRNVWVYSTSPWTVYVQEGSATFENVEIGHPDFIGERGIGGNNVTARRLDIHHVEDGIKAGDNSLYEHIHVHDLASLSDDPHADAVQADGGSSNTLIRNSILDSTGPLGHGNAAVLIKSDAGPIDGLTLVSNYMNGGAYTVFVRDGGHGFPTNIEIVDNVFGPDWRFGYTDIQGPVKWSRNVTEEQRREIDVVGNVGNPIATGETAPAPTEPTTSIVASSSDEAVPDSTPSQLASPEQRPTADAWTIPLIAALTISGFALGVVVTLVLSRKQTQDV